MEAFLNSALLVFISEMGDKTQLLSLVLTSRYQKPWVILAGVFTATLLNHAFAAWVGGWLAALMDPTTLRRVLALTFLGFAVWVLFPDKEGSTQNMGRWGAFATTLVSFFLAEMGDKTQLATISLAAKYPSVLIVTVGTTVGMMASNALAIFCGKKFLSRTPMHYIRIVASLLFAIFGSLILLGI